MPPLPPPTAAALGALLLCALLPLGPALAQSCSSRGELDALYCDEDRDLVADPPKDPLKLKNPGTLLYSYSPLDDPAVYERVFAPFMAHLRQCSGRKLKFYQVHSSAAAIEAMRSGRMHMGAFSTGDTAFAVNIAGAVPFATRGDAKGMRGYQLIVVVRSNSALRTLADLRGRKVAHTAPSSNSGNMAARALFPAAGVIPDKDYKVLYSGKHDNSILGVKSGDYDAAAVADDVLARLIERGMLGSDELRVIYHSATFPGGSLALAHDLDTGLARALRDCSLAYRYSPELVKAFQGADRWVPVNYSRDWAIVRKVAAAGGESFGRTAFDRRSAAGTANREMSR